MLAGSITGSGVAGSLIAELVAAFPDLCHAWDRWVAACLPGDAVSYARMRLLNALKRDGEQTMGQIAAALDVTPRRVTALVDAMEGDALVARRPSPRDRRSTLVGLTEAGVRQQQLGWERHQAEVAVAFSDLSEDDRVRLERISRELTSVVRARLCGRAPAAGQACPAAVPDDGPGHAAGAAGARRRGPGAAP
jgi:DNA-binding MarR family transcriptional regulator